MLNGERNEGSNTLMTMVAATMIASGPNQSVRRKLACGGHAQAPIRAMSAPREIHQHREQQQQPEPGLHPELADAKLQQPVGELADQRRAEEAPSTDTRPPASSVPPRTGPRNAGKSQSCPRSPAIEGMAAPVRATTIIAATPARTPERTWQKTNMRPTLTPESSAAAALAPAASIPARAGKAIEDGQAKTDDDATSSSGET